MTSLAELTHSAPAVMPDLDIHKMHRLKAGWVDAKAGCPYVEFDDGTLYNQTAALIPGRGWRYTLHRVYVHKDGEHGTPGDLFSLPMNDAETDSDGGMFSVIGRMENLGGMLRDTYLGKGCRHATKADYFRQKEYREKNILRESERKRLRDPVTMAAMTADINAKAMLAAVQSQQPQRAK